MFHRSASFTRLTGNERIVNSSDQIRDQAQELMYLCMKFRQEVFPYR